MQEMRDGNERLLIEAGFGDMATALDVAECAKTILHKLPHEPCEELDVRYLGSETDPKSGKPRFYVGKFARIIQTQNT